MKLKKFILSIFTLCLGLAVICSVSACSNSANGNDEIAVSGVQMEKSEYELKLGSSETLVVKINPVNATNQTVVWESDSPQIADVNSSGKVTAKSLGVATITASVASFSATCKVTVVPDDAIHVSSVTFTQASLSLEVGATYTNLVPTILPANATHRDERVWSSTDVSCVTVSDKGTITAVGVGMSVVTVTVEDKSASCTVIVHEKVDDVTLQDTAISLEVDSTYTLHASVTPSSVKITWSSSNDNIAVVDDNGKVTAKSVGAATITAAAGGKSATCAVTVIPKSIAVTGITLNKNTATIGRGSSEALQATVQPDNATDKTVVWSTSAENIATVTADGLVTGVSDGEAIITATAGTFSATCTVEVVTYSVTGITLDVEQLTLGEGATRQLVATLEPSNAYDKTVDWSSSEEQYATVDTSGVVHALKAGETVITATANGHSATCTVTVVEVAISYAYAGEECAAFEWVGTIESGTKVEYKMSSQSSYTALDSELIRQIKREDVDTVRADILGLKGGENYDFKITVKGGQDALAFDDVAISSIDRSGYAHHNFNEGVGGYNNDGTPKANAKIIYLTEENKNDIDGKGTSIAEYLKNAKNISTPVIIRVLGIVGSATWNDLTYSKGSGNLTEDEIVGINGQKLPEDANSLTQDALKNAGYNTLNLTPDEYTRRGLGECAPIDGLTSKATYSGGEYDSMWNDCTVQQGKNITIEGVGEDAEIFQWGFTFKNCNSIEVRNIRFFDYTEDACSFEGSDNAETISGFNSKNFWVHHNTFDIGKNYWDICPEQDKHDGDGATDFKKLAYVTLAYNRYNYTHKTGLVGGGDTHYQACFTFHHNYYNGCDQRMPLGRQANMHMYNNYYYSSGLYSISLRAGAYAFIENCVFTSSKPTTEPIQLIKGSNGLPSVKVVDCSMSGNIHVDSGIGEDHVYNGDDRSATVTGENKFGQNFDTQNDFYTVTNKLETSQVSTQIPLLAGTMKHNSSNLTGGGLEDDEGGGTAKPPVEQPTEKHSNVSVTVSDLVSNNTLKLESTAKAIQATLGSGIYLNTNSGKVTEHNKTIDGTAFTHRIILKGEQNYISVTTQAACKIKVYIANGSSNAGKRIFGLYGDADTASSSIGNVYELDGGETAAAVFEVTQSDTYYLKSITNELGVYRIDVIYDA